MYFPFFILHDWVKRSAEARSSHYAVLPQGRRFSPPSLQGVTRMNVVTYEGLIQLLMLLVYFAMLIVTIYNNKK